MAVDDLATIKLHTVYNDVYESAWGFRSISGVADWRTILLDGFATLMVPIIMGGMSNYLTLLELSIQDVVPGTGLDIVHTFPGPVHGGVDSPLVATQLAAKIHWFSGRSGRSGKGFTFLSGGPVSSLETDQNEWNVAGVSWQDDIIDAMLAAYGPTGTSTFARMVIISRSENKVPRAVPVGFDVVDAEDDRFVRTQRRRARS